MTTDVMARKRMALPAPAEDSRPATSVPTPAAKPAFLQQRLVSLDAYRGLIMVALAFNGFGLAATALRHIQAGQSPGFWDAVHYQSDHVEWVGCGFWDLIQPSFMFMVGVAAAFSYAKRKQEGQSYGRMFGHAVWRSLLLIFLGIFLISNFEKTTNWSLMNVLTQIGLGYTFLFLLVGRSLTVQAIAAGAILAGTWLLYVQYPHGFDDIGAGMRDAWTKNDNVGQAIDLWLLNQLPRKTPYVINNGGYQTINFLPSLATMLFGLMCGELLRSSASARKKLLTLIIVGTAGLLVGQVLNLTGVCPLVKRIWTPSWAIFSTGWCCLILASLYGLVDVLGYRRWTWPLVVVGVNSIAIYCMGMLLKPWTINMYKIHFGPDIFHAWGPLWEPTLTALLVGLFFWLMCWWMYRQKIFVRI